MKSDFNEWKLKIDIQNLRKKYLEPKNLNKYKRLHKETPRYISNIINAFERKIKGLNILSDEVKKRYFEELKEIYSNYYKEKFSPKSSKKNSYLNYLAENYINKIKNNLSFDDFIKQGLRKKYQL